MRSTALVACTYMAKELLKITNRHCASFRKQQCKAMSVYSAALGSGT
jgi:hypothetical protein